MFEKTLTAQEEANLKRFYFLKYQKLNFHRAERMQRNQTVAETALADLKDSNEVSLNIISRD